ncbi:zinc finger protein, putative [Pediculus humanus corporis]|uniref:Zinc finger protein 593 homolog n=1 Tax=Pediculus humanus subsp. corporis TaxID=121224 RepID=E0VBG2_PEDHC|nr:zinc finger protein, putative [Pediculus humanus corporis]EEB10718.1 zinc finger protein, putative [Pediculus humanus corporis]
MPCKRKKSYQGNKREKKRWRTRNRRKDLDEINEDLKPEKVSSLLHQEIDLNKPGCAQFYCIHCARYFIDQVALKEHFRSKGHKRRLKDLEEEPYTIEDSERAAGKGNFIEPKRRRIETQPLHEMEICNE